MTWERAAFAGLSLGYAGTALGAYNIGPIPIQWLAQGSLVALACALIATRDRIQAVPGGSVLLMFLLWSVLINVTYVARFIGNMPPRSTLPYVAYVGVRYINVLAFASAFYLVYWLLQRGYRAALVKRIIVISLAVTAVSFYIYLAQRLGLPELPRTRIGTSGGEQVTGIFSSSGIVYGRMMGTFREPSHMAEWLIVPFFLSLGSRTIRARIGSLLMGIAGVLTVSLTGIFSALVGWFLALFLLNPFRRANRRSILIGGLVLLILMVGLQRVAVGTFGADIFSILNKRTLELIEGGLTGSNRSYVYEFATSNPPPFLGYGLGNGSVHFANVTGSELVVSFLSLYLATLYATGIPGFTLLVIFLAIPIVRVLRSRAGPDPMRAGMLMGYLAYLVAFAVAPEELSVPFGIVAALLAYRPPPATADPIVAPSQAAVAAGG